LIWIATPCIFIALKTESYD
jgi:hypothetical protein